LADTRTLKDPIVGFVFDAKGLIADISLKGAKFSKLIKKNSLCDLFFYTTKAFELEYGVKA
jgi:lipid-binding SYLF domain-containing protein